MLTTPDATAAAAVARLQEIWTVEAELNEANNQSPIDVLLSLPVFGFAASVVNDQLRYRRRCRVVRRRRCI